MDKTKTSKEPGVYLEKLSNIDLKKIPGIKREHPVRYLMDEDKIGKAILECLKNNDPVGVIEMIIIHLKAINKTDMLHKGHISKSTLYHSLRNKNPTIKTLAKLVHSYTH